VGKAGRSKAIWSTRAGPRFGGRRRHVTPKKRRQAAALPDNCRPPLPMEKPLHIPRRQAGRIGRLRLQNQAAGSTPPAINSSDAGTEWVESPTLLRLIPYPRAASPL
jgi:hypothetical protein